MNAHSPPSRLLLWTPFALAGVLVLVWAGIWTAGADAMKRSVEEWANKQRESGLTVVYDPPRVRGFPFYLRGSLANIEIADATRWRWRAETLFVDTLPYAVDRMVFSTRAPQTLEFHDHGAWTLNAESIRASYESGKGRKWSFDMESGPAALTRNSGNETIRVRRFLLSAARDPDNKRRAAASLIIDGLTTRLSRGDVDVNLIEAFIEGEQTPAGGVLNLRRIVLDAGGGKLALAGALHLDERGYPAGRLNAEIVNPATITGLLATAGALSSAEAEQAGAALTLAAIAGGGVLRAPVLLENGAAHIAGARVGRLPQIAEPPGDTLTGD